MLSSELIAHVNEGGVVAYPTSTLPGLACLPVESSLDALFELKQRPADKPVSLGVLSLDQAASLVQVPEKIRALEASFPKGVFTFILDAVAPLDVRLGGSRVAVRCWPPHRSPTRGGFRADPATSANESGESPEPTAEAAGASLGHRITPSSPAIAPVVWGARF